MAAGMPQARLSYVDWVLVHEGRLHAHHYPDRPARVCLFPDLAGARPVSVGVDVHQHAPAPIASTVPRSTHRPPHAHAPAGGTRASVHVIVGIGRDRRSVPPSGRSCRGCQDHLPHLTGLRQGEHRGGVHGGVQREHHTLDHPVTNLPGFSPPDDRAVPAFRILTDDHKPARPLRTHQTPPPLTDPRAGPPPGWSAPLFAHRRFHLRCQAGQICFGTGSNASSGTPSTSCPGGGPTTRSVGRGMKLAPHSASTLPSPPIHPRWVSWSASDREYQARGLSEGSVVVVVGSPMIGNHTRPAYVGYPKVGI